MKKIKIIIVCLLTIMVSACSSNPKEYAFNLAFEDLKLPSGIYYKDHIYWEMAQKVDKEEGEKIGTLKSVAKENFLPGSELMGTYDLENCIDQEIYQKDDTMYLKTKESVRVYQYITKMTLNDEVKKFEVEEGVDGGMAAPHFVYQDMRYFTYYSQPVEHFDYFKEVGEIKENYDVANKNFTGNIVIGDKLYACDFQNRFILVKSANDGKFYVYENEVYRNQGEKE